MVILHEKVDSSVVVPAVAAAFTIVRSKVYRNDASTVVEPCFVLHAMRLIGSMIETYRNVGSEGAGFAAGFLSSSYELLFDEDILF
jgi:hypothetical protein